MAKQLINTGVGANDGTGDSIRDGANKVNNNFNEVYSQLGNGNSLRIDVSGATTGQILAYNGASFVPSSSSAIAYNAVQADTGTVVATNGNTTLGIFGTGGINTSVSGNILTISGSGSGGGGGASVTVAATPPASPSDGDLWYDSELGILAVWFSSESVWIQTNGSSVIESFTGDINTSGSTTFLSLTDTPQFFGGSENKILSINSTGTAIEFIENTGGSGSGTGLTPVDITSADSPYTATSYDLIFVDTTAATVTVTLPSSPTKGDEIRIVDLKGTFDTNACTITSNYNIQGAAEDLIVDVERAAFGLLFHSATDGWVMKDR
tara:strand:- start:716 stop:1684 length:969 start_codon:yes stop_codon:yes gene_type:complete